MHNAYALWGRRRNKYHEQSSSILHLLHGHASTEDGGDGQVAAVTRVARCHHVLGVEHLLRQLGHGQRTVLLAATRRQRSKAGHEEVQSRERNHVDGQLAQIRVQLHSSNNAKTRDGNRTKFEPEEPH